MKVQTVLGAIDAADMGKTLFHEHLFLTYPGVELDSRLDHDRDAMIRDAARRLTELREVHGVATFIDPCPIEMGRDVDAAARVSELSGVNIVYTTGFYHEPMGVPPYWRELSAAQVAEFYVTEIERGVMKTGIRVGAIKCATGEPAITAGEEKFLTAAAMAQAATGVPIITHTTSGRCGPEQQDVFAAAGADLGRIVIGHCCENPDTSYHRRIVERGSFIGFDRIGWSQFQSDEVRAASLAALVDGGFGGHVLLSQDRYTDMRWLIDRKPTDEEIERRRNRREAGTWPAPYTHLFTSFMPLAVAKGIAEPLIETMLSNNVRRLFAGEGPMRG